MTDLRRFEFVANELRQALNQTIPVRSKLYETACTAPLTIEEMYKVREALTQIGAWVNQLDRVIEETDEEAKKPRWKKLLKK